MKFIYIVIVFMVTGCYQAVNENDWNLGTAFCKSKNSEILQIEANFLGGEHYKCKNLEYKNNN